MANQHPGRKAALDHGSVDQPLLLTIPEIIQAARSSRATVYAEINSGRLKTVKIGRRRYATPQAAQDWIQRLTEDSEVAS